MSCCHHMMSRRFAGILSARIIMDSMVVGGVTFACTFGGALLGMWLRTVLPEAHISGDSRDVIEARHRVAGDHLRPGARLADRLGEELVRRAAGRLSADHHEHDFA